MASSAKPTLGYWKIRGLASQIRYTMVYLGVDFDEHQYEQGDAPDFDRSAWLNVKETLGLTFPNLPYFIDGDVRLTESSAIIKYICSKHGPSLLGRTPAEIAHVEMVAGVIGDLKGAVTMPCYTSGDRAAISALILEKIKPISAYLGNKTFLVGDSVTYVDFILFELCELMSFITEGQLFAQNHNLGPYCDRVKGLPRLSEYYADDTKCMKRPFNNKVAKLNN